MIVLLSPTPICTKQLSQIIKKGADTIERIFKKQSLGSFCGFRSCTSICCNGIARHNLSDQIRYRHFLCRMRNVTGMAGTFKAGFSKSILLSSALLASSDFCCHFSFQKTYKKKNLSHNLIYNYRIMCYSVYIQAYHGEWRYCCFPSGKQYPLSHHKNNSYIGRK